MVGLGVGVCIGFSLGFASAVLVSRSLFDYLRFRWKLKASLTQMQRDAAQAELREQQIALIRENKAEASASKAPHIDVAWVKGLTEKHADNLSEHAAHDFGLISPRDARMIVRAFGAGACAAAAEILGPEALVYPEEEGNN